MLAALPQQDLYARALGAERLDLPAGAGFAYVLRRCGVGAVVRGPVWQSEAFGPRVDALRALRQLGVWLIEPDGPCPSVRAAGFLRLVTAQTVAEINLRSWDRSRMGVKFRQKVRKADRAGVEVRASTWDGRPHWLLDRAVAQERQRGYRGLPRAAVAALARTDPGAATIWTGHVAHEPVAGMLILQEGDVATCQLGWTGAAGRAASAHHLILATIAERLASSGVRRLDLGRVEPDRNPGLARFKAGCGATFRDLGGSWLALPGPRRRL